MRVWTLASRLALGVGASLLPVLAAAALIGLFVWFVPRALEPAFTDYRSLDKGTLVDAQTQALAMVKELNSYLISLSTLIVGGVGWYLSQYRSALRPAITRTAFFFAVGLMGLAAWYAFQTYAQIVTELAQDVIALTPGQSRILWYLQLESASCGIGILLLLLIFADAVTRKPDPLEE